MNSETVVAITDLAVSYTHLDVYKRQDLFSLFEDTIQRLLKGAQ